MERYSLTAVARTPNQLTGPTLTDLAGVTAPSMSWTQNLDRPDELRFSCKASRLISNVRDRCRNPFLLPIEFRLERDKVPLFSGPLVNVQVQNGTLSAYCADALWYTTKMAVPANVTYTTADKAAIAAGLIDTWQVLDYGDYGIDTSAVGTTGVTESISYRLAEANLVYDRLRELGVDIWVEDRVLHVAALRGTDRSTGSGKLILDARNVKDGSASMSIAQSASDAYGVGTGDTPITSLQADTTARQSFGRSAIFETFDGVTQQPTLDAHTQRLRDRHKALWFQPGVGLRPVADVDIDSFDVGDTVLYSFDAGLGVHEGAYRVASKQVDIDSMATESLAVAFL